MDTFKKYFVEDVYHRDNPVSHNIHYAVLILENHPATNAEFRKKHADILKSIGLTSLANYLEKQYQSYNDFAQAAAPEQRERIQYASNLISSQPAWAWLPTSVIQQKIDQQQQTRQSLEQQQQHLRQQLLAEQEQELARLHQKHKQQYDRLLQKQKQQCSETDIVSKQLKFLLKIRQDPQFAAEWKAQQQRLQQEKERREAEERAKKERLQQEFKLLSSFDIDYIRHDSHRQALFPILRKLSLDERLTEEEIVWLETEGKAYFAKGRGLYRKHHHLEADFHTGQFKKHPNNLWHLVNASSHWRKAERSEYADNLFNDIKQKTIKKVNNKLQSALLTTHGGVKRDLSEYSTALDLAHEAHQQAPKDYRPCTLLGAIYMETRDFDQGHHWFELAEELGAPEKNTDAEIKAIYHKADKAGKEALKNYLLKLDAKRYAWLCKKAKSNAG